jgi:hypothetical protein
MGEAELALIVKIVLTSAITGGISTFATVKALNVHINYINRALVRLDKAVLRAHERIDSLEKCQSK